MFFSKLCRNRRIFAWSFSLSCHMTMRLLLQACKKGTFYFLSHLLTLSVDRQYETQNLSAVNSFQRKGEGIYCFFPYMSQKAFYFLIERDKILTHAINTWNWAWNFIPDSTLKRREKYQRTSKYLKQKTPWF